VNERIQQLGIAAGLIVEKWDGFNRRQLNPAEQKFAELIVAECADLCDRYQDIPATEPRHCAQDIRSLFGATE